ncbi:hypothetical protein HOK51_08985 [Candidatus Woesearchaeota archaeon]|nr:hypothetical protein [Candidatus Woesearchaeota archaeon]MBT6519963.1 hypothetical protein [Candidatus Woesearchaeota archaeon]MBT7367836.1 hypothetical protein [Candidatus Woesearchaeota archaeon]
MQAQLLKPELVVLYGSRKKESDIDLLLVYENGPIEKNQIKDNYDLSQVTKSDYLFRLTNWDLEYTEPILTGSFVEGNNELFKSSLEYLKNNKPNEQNLDYLNKRSIETFFQAKKLYELGKNNLLTDMFKQSKSADEICNTLLKNKSEQIQTFDVLKSLSVLTYSLSYLSFRQKYEMGNSNVTLSNVLEFPKTDLDKKLLDLRMYVKLNKKTGAVTLNNSNDHFLDAEKLLKKYI